jgi:hypothetical protein
MTITRITVDIDSRNYEMTYVDELVKVRAWPQKVIGLRWEKCFSIGGMTAYGDLPAKAHSALYDARQRARINKPATSYYCDY